KDPAVEQLARQLDAVAPPRPATPWNWNSPAQVKEALQLLGHDVEDTSADTLAAVDHPFAKTKCDLASVRHRVSHFGEEALRWVADDGRIHASWSPLGNDAGRSACKNPNLQGVTKDETLRGCFIAPPPGRVLVRADWSQAHLRIVAKLAH